MYKRGISPLIITVILVGFVVVMASFIFMWSSGLTKSEMNKQNFNFILYDYGVEYSPFEEDYPCDDIVDAGECVPCDNAETLSCYCILINNEESKAVNYLVKTTGSSGVSVCDPADFEVGAFESKVFGVAFDETAVGSVLDGIEADVEAVSL